MFSKVAAQKLIYSTQMHFYMLPMKNQGIQIENTILNGIKKNKIFEINITPSKGKTSNGNYKRSLREIKDQDKWKDILDSWSSSYC